MDLGGIALILLRLAAFFGGLYVVAATLGSAIRTFVLPRSAPDQIVRVVFLLIRTVFDFRTRKATTYEQRDQVMAMYAPLSLIALPVVWLVLVALGGGLIYWALGIGAAHDAMLFSASAILTLGAAQISGLFQTGFAFAEATIGLLLTAILIAYLPTMYTAFSARETLVTMLEVRAGSPPTPSTMFQRMNRLKHLDSLGDIWSSWEVWFTQLEETHTSLAALAFFRSPQPHRSWITATGAVLDSAALSLALLDIPYDYRAALTIRAGFLALRQIADFFGIEYNANPQPTDPISVQREEFDEVADELASAGIPLKADREQAWNDFKGWRVNYDVPLIALARLVMAPYAPWSSDRSNRRVRASLRLKPRKP
ncbi:MAG: hypothetical protein ACYDBJ_17555 [Aggregatilineales bacterium]